MTGSGRPTSSAKFPVAAHSVTQRTHGDVVLRVADFHAGEPKRDKKREREIEINSTGQNGVQMGSTCALRE